MKVGAEELVEPTRTNLRVSAVADSSRNVWYHCRVRTGGICANSRKPCVPSLLFYPPARAKCRLFSRAVNPRIDYPLFAGFIHLGAGLACGFTGLAAGYAIGFVGDSVSRSLSSICPAFSA